MGLSGQTLANDNHIDPDNHLPILRMELRLHQRLHNRYLRRLCSADSSLRDLLQLVLVLEICAIVIEHALTLDRVRRFELSKRPIPSVEASDWLVLVPLLVLVGTILLDHSTVQVFFRRKVVCGWLQLARHEISRMRYLGRTVELL